MRPLAIVVFGAITASASASNTQTVQDNQDPRAVVLTRLNEHRTAAGLSTVEEDPELSKGCQAHADYISKNKGREELKGQGMHREAKSLPGYSEAGHVAAADSDIAFYGR